MQPINHQVALPRMPVLTMAHSDLATGTPETGGWSTRELLSILAGLEGLEIVGADVVEVSPPFDNHGETTVIAAADIVHTLIDLMVTTPVKNDDQE